ncbi:MAG TPA: M20/M25/M40 family metallo-hydrolase [Thermoleophilaceae bacterium]|nr:M20/M25/M40 family metallo-hydrolase [Thermoleophilaceae bacterium]
MPEPEDLERRTTELLQRLIRFNTVNPPGDEQACQDYLAEMLGGAGFTTEQLSAVEGRPNLVARLPSGSDGPVLCLLGHVDTVLADPADWTVDPWSGDIKDGCVWGRGALDMKSQVAAEVAAAVALAEQGWRPETGELKLVITADEETGAAYGAQWLCEEHPEKVRADLVVNEGAGESFEYGGKRVYGVCVAEKGVFRFRLTTNGTAGHASIPRIGDNALVKMAPVLEALAGGRVSPEHTPEGDAFLAALGAGDDDLQAALAEVEATDPRVAVLLEPMLGVTLSPTMITASQKINVIPAHASLDVDCRVPPELGEEHALERIHEAIGGEDGYEIAFRDTVVGNRSPIDSPLMETIRSFVEREDPGAEVTPVVLPGFSDSRWFREAFPDCVAYGFFPQRTMDLFEAAPLIHGADERVPVEDLGLAARFYTNLIEETLR